MRRPSASQVLVLGLGDDLRTDEAIGLHVAQCVLERLDRDGILGIDVVATSDTGHALLDILVGHGDMILIDAVQTGRCPPGAIHEIFNDRCLPLSSMSERFVGLTRALAKGRKLGLPVPRRIRILGIEAQDPFTPGTALTPALRRVMPGAVERVLNLALHWSLDRAGGRATSRTAAHGHATKT